MSIIKSIKRALGLAVAAAPAIVITDVQRAVAALKALPIGATVAADIAALKDASLSGAQKFETVVAKTTPAIVELLAPGGTAAVAADVGDIARALVQDVYNDTLSTKAGAIARAVLALLGIR